MPRMLDLFCGRLGWSKAFLARGWECVGVDLVEPPELPGRFCFVMDDILNFDGDLMLLAPVHWPLAKDADWVRFDFICASSPCEQFSVHGMKHFHPNPPYPEMGIKLFNHTRAICEASGVPYVMENVRAAQQFVGNAVHHCGPFYLWGSGVPPMMPQGIIKGMNITQAWDPVTGKRAYAGPRMYSSGSKERAREVAKLATIPPELAHCVADYAERLLEQRLAS